MSEQNRITPEQMRAIEAALKKGDRIEIIPQKEGVKIVHVRRTEIKA